MTTRQVKAVAEAVYRITRYVCNEDEARYISKASDARFVPMLVYTIKMIASGKDFNGRKIDFFQDLAQETLNKLPEEMRDD